MNDFILYEQDIAKLSEILSRHIRDAQLICALLTNKEGQLLTCQGATDTLDTTSIAALITGSFAATVSIAQFIGETEFSTMLHRGKNKHIHIQLVDVDRYLASIFDNKTTPEKVGQSALRNAKELRDYLLAMTDNVKNAYLPDLGEEFIPPVPEGSQSPQPASPPMPEEAWQPAEILSPEEKRFHEEPVFSSPPAGPVPEEQLVSAHSGQDVPTPSNTAYLRVKILEAQSLRKKKHGFFPKIGKKQV